VDIFPLPTPPLAFRMSQCPDKVNDVLRRIGIEDKATFACVPQIVHVALASQLHPPARDDLPADHIPRILLRRM
jgi:hypothetical protein